MKHFQSSTSVVVEVPAQQLFVHLTVFLHKTKVHALKHTEALNKLFLKFTNTTTFLQDSCGRECRGAVLECAATGTLWLTILSWSVWGRRWYVSRCASSASLILNYFILTYHSESVHSCTGDQLIYKTSAEWSNMQMSMREQVCCHSFVWWLWKSASVVELTNCCLLI